ncbi:MAG: helix-turn-helix transcriptional regulator [Sandaracinus sp.]|nr:helix-turn-helix transcriptional regulator [Sandaracinus sp.]MCB9616428.1 helix-turn-helix transcriptional regulator [Sandaracinus sp.]MCB9631950.1 helix-turn-helix transcriptional regulator [Sandaracinus sp.]
MTVRESPITHTIAGGPTESGVWPRFGPMARGSVGVFVLVSNYGPYVPHVGTSPCVFDDRFATHRASPIEEPSVDARKALLATPAAELMRELLAALSLNKTQLSEILRVTRPTVYEWLGGKEPSEANAQRLATVIEALAQADVSSERPLGPRLVRQPLREGQSTILEMLTSDPIDVARLVALLREAAALRDQASDRRRARDEKLRARGFEEPTTDERRERLAKNVALLDWPED